MNKKKTPDDTSAPITLEATLFKINTTIDGGWNITFAVSQSESEHILKLSEHRDVSLGLAIVPINQN